MSGDDILTTISDRAVIRLDAQQLAEVLERTEEVESHDTGMAGMIRILRHGDRYLVQESTDKGVPILRALSSLELSRQLVRERLSAYERMWDGCGCRIDYFS